MLTVIDEVKNVSECMLKQKDIPDHLLTRRIYIVVSGETFEMFCPFGYK